MTPAALSLVIGLAAFIGHALIVPLLLRATPRAAPVKIHVGSAVSLHLLQILVTMFVGQAGSPLPYWHGAAVFGAGAIGYLFLFSAVYKSISLRMLAVLMRDKGQATRLDALTDAVTLPEFEQRVRILLESRLAMASGGTYAITDAGRTMAARLIRLQRAFGVRRSGLY